MTVRIPKWALYAAGGTAIVAVAIVATLLVTGGSSSEDDAVDAAQAYLRAIGESDGETACSHLTAEAASALEDEVSSQGLGIVLGSGCAEIIENLADEGGATADQLAELSDVTIESVQIEDDFAEINLRGATVPLELERDGGEWKINADTIRASFGINSR